MNKFLITPSLLSSFAYFLNYDEDEARALYSQDANLTANVKTNTQIRAEFLQTLSRVKSPPNEAMQKGIDFEAAVEAYTQAKFMCENPNESEPIKAIGDIVAGGLWQQKCDKEIIVDNVPYLLYGRIDVVKRNWIYDIKFVTKTANYELGKYFDAVQKLIYPFCTGIKNFAYLTSDGKQWWRDDFLARSEEILRVQIEEKIREFRNYLRNDEEAEKLFLTNWGSK